MPHKSKTDEPIRVPVNFRYDGLNWDFIRMLAEIAHYADQKYGSVEQYANMRLDEDLSPANHIVEHLRLYLTGAPHDHFDDRVYHLAAIAYNAMMEAFYFKKFGRPPSVLNLQSTKFDTRLTSPFKDVAPRKAVETVKTQSDSECACRQVLFTRLAEQTGEEK